MGEQPTKTEGRLEAPASAGGADTALDIASLVRAYHREVYRYAYRLTGQQADAEDLSQQTFLVAQQRLQQLREPGKAINWLFTILRNCYLKGQTKRQAVLLGSAELEDIECLPEQLADDGIDRQQLQLAIDELPDEFKIVVVMFYFQDCSYKEIAAQLGISMGTVMSRLARAKGRLRKRLLPSEPGTGPTSASTAARDSSGRATWSQAAELRRPLSP